MKTIPLTKETVVDCNTWYRGRSGFNSQLLTLQNERCCLGFAAKQSGIDDGKLRNIGSPYSLYRLHDISITQFLVFRSPSSSCISNTSWVAVVMEINDDTAISDTERMRKLTEHWETLGEGYSVRFENVPKE